MFLEPASVETVDVVSEGNGRSQDYFYTKHNATEPSERSVPQLARHTDLTTDNPHTNMSTPQKPILLSGAGISTLLLARVLLRNSISFRIYERDASLAFRGQGYRLRLSTEGLNAIEEALGPEAWPAFWEKCGKTGGSGLSTLDARTGEDYAGADAGTGVGGEKKAEGSKQGGSEGSVNAAAKPQKGGQTALNLLSQPGTLPREALGSRDGLVVGIARGEMRSLFIEGCEEYVSWGKHVTSYELTSTGVHAIFADGTKSEEGSMLIGGEGIKSSIAKQLSGGALKVYDLGARGIHGQAPTSAFKGLGEGVFRIVDDENSSGRISIITNVRRGDMDDPNVQFGWTMIGVPGAITAPNNDYSLVGPEAAKLAKDLTKDWSGRFKPLFEQMVTSEAAFWKITCSSPEGVPQWENEGRVSLIGDAVHSMVRLFAYCSFPLPSHPRYPLLPLFSIPF